MAARIPDVQIARGAGGLEEALLIAVRLALDVVHLLGCTCADPGAGLTVALALDAHVQPATAGVGVEVGKQHTRTLLPPRVRAAPRPFPAHGNRTACAQGQPSQRLCSASAALRALVLRYGATFTALRHSAARSPPAAHGLQIIAFPLPE